MGVVWLLDRATGLLAYPALWLAVASGVWYDARGLGVLRDWARAVHVPVAAFACLFVLGHGALGTLDVMLVLLGESPMPPYGPGFLVVGAAVGAGAFLVLAVAVLAFLDPLRGARPWSPRTVHALAYAGYGFATVHAAAVGTDIGAIPTTWTWAGLLVLAYMVVVREVAATDAVGVAGGQ